MGEKFQRWVRNFGNEASKGKEQMEKQRRKREKRTEKMRGMREKFRGNRRSKIYIYIYIFFFLYYCEQYNSMFRIVL